MPHPSHFHHHRRIRTPHHPKIMMTTNDIYSAGTISVAYSRSGTISGTRSHGMTLIPTRKSQRRIVDQLCWMWGVVLPRKAQKQHCVWKGCCSHGMTPTPPCLHLRQHNLQRKLCSMCGESGRWSKVSPLPTTHLLVALKFLTHPIVAGDECWQSKCANEIG